MRRQLFTKWLVGQFDRFMIFCTATRRRTTICVATYCTLFILSVVFFPLWRLIVGIAVAVVIAVLFLASTLGSFTEKPPK